MSYGVFYGAAHGSFPVEFVFNHCGRVFSICHVTNQTRFASADEARAAALAAGMAHQTIEVRAVHDSPTPPDRDPARSETARGADSPAGAARCANCGKPAACIGAYEGSGEAFACDNCCAHGNEDGWCNPVSAHPNQILTQPKENHDCIHK